MLVGGQQLSTPRLIMYNGCKDYDDAARESWFQLLEWVSFARLLHGSHDIFVESETDGDRQCDKRQIRGDAQNWEEC